MTQSAAGAAESVVWLTQEAYDRLAEELDHLKGPGRADTSRRIAEAREEGDLKENSGYHAAREEQSKSEARIKQLEDMLERAQVGEVVDSGGAVEAGMEVTVKFLASSDTETFLLGARENSDSADVTSYSPQSPLGTAILGARPGDQVSFTAANGKTVEVEIIEAKPFIG